MSGSGRNNRRVGATARSKITVFATRVIAGNYVGIGNIRYQLLYIMDDHEDQQAMG